MVKAQNKNLIKVFYLPKHIFCSQSSGHHFFFIFKTYYRNSSWLDLCWSGCSEQHINLRFSFENFKQRKFDHIVIIMSGEIVTKDLGDGYYLHTLNIETYYLTETIIGKTPIPDSITAQSPFLPIPQSLGQYEPYRLSQFVNSRDAIVQKGEIVKLAEVENNKLKINPYALEIFKHYEDNEISFVGNYGRLRSGKSFWYDKILNLSQFDGNNFTSNTGKQGIYFWSIPFTKGNLKFFLLDYVGFDDKETLTQQDQKLLDLELFLAQKFIVVPEPEDQQLTILQPAQKHLLESQKRFSDRGIPANKFSPYWPNQIYTLYRSAKPVRKEIDSIGSLFQIYNFSIIHDALSPGSQATKQDLKKSTIKSSNAAQLNEKYVRMTSIVFQDIYEKMKGKHYSGVTFNGRNLPKILQQAGTSINIHKAVKIDQIFKGVRKDIADDAIVRSKNTFLKEVEFIPRNGTALPLDIIIQGFERGNRAAFEEFDKADLATNEKEEAEIKLRQQIDYLEQSILQQNKRKTLQHYEMTLSYLHTDDTNQAKFQKLKESFSQSKHKNGLDHQDSLLVAQKLKQISKNSLKGGQQQIIVLDPNVNQHIHVQNLKKRIQNRKQHLNEVLTEGVELTASKDDEQNDTKKKYLELINRINELKGNINFHKQTTNSNIQEKQCALNKLREIHTNNQILITSIPPPPTLQQEIKAIQELIKQTAAKNKQHEQGLSNLDRSLSIRSGRSVIRDIKEQTIKKVTLK